MPCEQFKNSLGKKKTERLSLNHKYTIKDELHVRLVCIATYNQQLQLIRITSKAARRQNAGMLLVEGAAAMLGE